MRLYKVIIILQLKEMHKQLNSMEDTLEQVEEELIA